MHTIRHTIRRNGAFYYNRRVPNHAQDAFGAFIRLRLSDDESEARGIAESLTRNLNGLWRHDEIKGGIDLSALVEASRPCSRRLTDLSETYLRLKGMDAVPVRAAVSALIAVSGDKDVADYNRQDARAFVGHLTKRGNATATIRRRIGSIAAILNYAYAEHEIDKRNPFSRLLIEREGEDERKRGVFSPDQLRNGYREAFRSGSHVKLLMPLLGETGCRIAEIVGLRIEDLDLEKELLRIRPNPSRRLKTKGSEREIPLVGAALEAARIIMGDRKEGFLFPRYLKDGTIQATHASNAVGKWLKREFGGLTAHCLRHTFRDRLRAVECPLELIDQLGGWSSVGTIGSRYGAGFSYEQRRKWLQKIITHTKYI